MTLSGWLQYLMGLSTFRVTPERFPKGTAGAISVENILRYGVLPLGTKQARRNRAVLNVGVLNPRVSGLFPSIEKCAREALGEKYAGYRIYRLQPEEYSKVLFQIYGTDVYQVMAQTPEKVGPKLRAESPFAST